MLMKARLAGAHKGHGLLKKKADALQMRFRMILSKIIEVDNFSDVRRIPKLLLVIFLDQNIDGRCYEGSCVFAC
jgi:ATP synthase subunit D